MSTLTFLSEFGRCLTTNLRDEPFFKNRYLLSLWELFIITLLHLVRVYNLSHCHTYCLNSKLTFRKRCNQFAGKGMPIHSPILHCYNKSRFLKTTTIGIRVSLFFFFFTDLVAGSRYKCYVITREHRAMRLVLGCCDVVIVCTQSDYWPRWVTVSLVQRAL